MAQNARRSRSRKTRLQGLRKAVDEGANSAEDIHKRLANLPLDVLGESGALEGTVKRVRRFQDRSIHAVYQLVRDINHEVVRFASDVLPPRRHKAGAARKKPAAKARAERSTAA